MNREFNEYVFKMGFNGRIDSETRAFIKFYRQKYSSYKRDDIPLVPWLAKKCKVSVRSVYRLIKEPVGDRKDKEKKGGRKRILSTRTENRLIRNINKMRHMNKNWIVRDLMAFCDIDHVSERTVQRILNENGYGYRHARRKGVQQKGLNLQRNLSVVESTSGEKKYHFILTASDSFTKHDRWRMQ